MKLQWSSVPSPLPDMQMWSARAALMSFLISHDKGCNEDDKFYGRFALSSRLAGSNVKDLGIFDTFPEAQEAAEKHRRTMRRAQ